MANSCPLLRKHQVGDASLSYSPKFNKPETDWGKRICWRFCPPDENGNDVDCVLNDRKKISSKRRVELLATKIPLWIDGRDKCRRCKEGDVKLGDDGRFTCIQCSDEYSVPRQ